jgi:hypothetical protein
MLDAALDIPDAAASIALVPRPIEFLGDSPELHDQVAGRILGVDLAALYTPQTDQRGFVTAHDDPGVGAANEAAPTFGLG